MPITSQINDEIGIKIQSISPVSTKLAKIVKSASAEGKTSGKQKRRNGGTEFRRKRRCPKRIGREHG